jgi:DNA polymerase III, delta subunit
VTSLLPWPEESLAPRSWSGVGRLLERCRDLHSRGELPGTLMLVGDPGLGREALAVELAASLVCHGGGQVRCRCGSCERLRRGVHPDLEVLDVLPGKTEILIEQVRAVVDNLAQRPYEGHQRLFIVASAHTPPLNSGAASAFLKTLEEPPLHVTVLLLACNPARVLPTIVSRTVQLRLPAPTLAEIASLLASTHGVSEEKAKGLLDAARGDAALVLGSGSGDLAEKLAEARALVGSALAGDSLALLRLGVSVKHDPGRLAWVVDSLVHLAGSSSPKTAERALGAAAALLAADRRRAVLHLDLESTVTGTLAPLLAPA